MVGHYSDNGLASFAKDVGYPVLGCLTALKKLLFAAGAIKNGVLFVNIVIEHFGPSLWGLVVVIGLYRIEGPFYRDVRPF